MFIDEEVSHEVQKARPFALLLGPLLDLFVDEEVGYLCEVPKVRPFILLRYLLDSFLDEELGHLHRVRS